MGLTLQELEERLKELKTKQVIKQQQKDYQSFLESELLEKEEKETLKKLRGKK